MMENKTKVDLKNTSIFITGAAGFIGSNLAKRILTTVEGAKVVGLDNMNHYYDVRLKEARLDELNKFENFSFVKGNLADKETITTIFEQYKPQIVVNLGAQAGVRYSITNPDAYVEANLIGFYNILEACRHSYDEGHGQRFYPSAKSVQRMAGERYEQENPPLIEKPVNQKFSLHQMEHYQKFYENGEYVRAVESTTEQNYNMIDGCANNLPKPRIINGRESVLDKLRIRQMAREKQKSSQEQSADMERNRK